MGVEIKVDTKGSRTFSQKLRAEASRQASMANKRIKRLENAGYNDSPAYKKWVEEGGEYFSVRGKTINEVQTELARLRAFNNAQTSTIRGTNRVLKEMANNTGIKYKTLNELKSKSSSFFELASKTEQYLRTSREMASAIGYQKIWEQINQYIDTDEIELDGSVDDIDKYVELMAEAIVRDQISDTIEDMAKAWFKL